MLRMVLWGMFIALGASAAPICESVLTEERGFDRVFQIKHFVKPATHMGKRSQYVKLADLFGDTSKSILIGVEGKGHAYLLVDGMRFDGMIAPKRATIRSDVDSIRMNAVVMKFDSVPQEKIDSLRSYLKEKSRRWSLSCFHGVCRTLEKGAGIRVERSGSSGWRAGRIFEGLLKNGLIVEPATSKVPYELYSVGDVSISSLSAGIRKQEDKERTAFAALIVLVVGPIAIELVIEAID